MSSKKSRVELLVDVLDRPGQRALALATLTPEEFIAATLQEFRDVALLGIAPEDYVLCDAISGDELERTRPFEALPAAAEIMHLQLREREAPLPPGSRRPAVAAYLQDANTGAVHKVNWVPAIIGRPDPTQADNYLLAVDLQSAVNGLRVSRRHALITEKEGRFAVQTLSGNPVTLRHEGGKNETVDGHPAPLHSGDVIYLNRSEIALTFFIRQQNASALADGRDASERYLEEVGNADSAEENPNG